MTFERVAWIRIVGLLIQFWVKKNLEDIAGMFGRTITPYDDIPHCVDLSHAKIGIQLGGMQLGLELLSLMRIGFLSNSTI